ncbi:MAG: Holliday junction resolvase RuvX [Clostridia bacterium]|nr:Holliday junction resolvase RuvX [Clostridia bacterium]
MNGRIVGLDVGDVRIGIALSDETRLIATPHSVYTRVGWGPDVKHIQRLYAEVSATLIVCGLPRNMDGSVGFQAEKVKGFAEQLRKAGLPVVFQDERLSTVSAHQALIEGGMRRDSRKETVDKVAAAVILQTFLDGQGNGSPAGSGMNE